MAPSNSTCTHQIRNVIGVNPTFYEFLLHIDADTVVSPDSATRMVSAFLNDTRLVSRMRRDNTRQCQVFICNDDSGL